MASRIRKSISIKFRGVFNSSNSSIPTSSAGATNTTLQASNGVNNSQQPFPPKEKVDVILKILSDKSNSLRNLVLHEILCLMEDSAAVTSDVQNVVTRSVEYLGDHTVVKHDESSACLELHLRALSSVIHVASRSKTMLEPSIRDKLYRNIAIFWKMSQSMVSPNIVFSLREVRTCLKKLKNEPTLLAFEYGAGKWYDEWEQMRTKFFATKRRLETFTEFWDELNQAARREFDTLKKNNYYENAKYKFLKEASRAMKVSLPDNVDTLLIGYLDLMERTIRDFSLEHVNTERASNAFEFCQEIIKEDVKKQLSAKAIEVILVIGDRCEELKSKAEECLNIWGTGKNKEMCSLVKQVQKLKEDKVEVEENIKKESLKFEEGIKIQDGAESSSTDKELQPTQSDNDGKRQDSLEKETSRTFTENEIALEDVVIVRENAKAQNDLVNEGEDATVQNDAVITEENVNIQNDAVSAEENVNVQNDDFNEKNVNIQNDVDAEKNINVQSDVNAEENINVHNDVDVNAEENINVQNDVDVNAEENVNVQNDVDINAEENENVLNDADVEITEETMIVQVGEGMNVEEQETEIVEEVSEIPAVDTPKVDQVVKTEEFLNVDTKDTRDFKTTAQASDAIEEETLGVNSTGTIIPQPEKVDINADNLVMNADTNNVKIETQDLNTPGAHIEVENLNAEKVNTQMNDMTVETVETHMDNVQINTMHNEVGSITADTAETTTENQYIGSITNRVESVAINEVENNYDEVNVNNVNVSVGQQTIENDESIVENSTVGTINNTINHQEIKQGTTNIENLTADEVKTSVAQQNIGRAETTIENFSTTNFENNIETVSMGESKTSIEEVHGNILNKIGNVNVEKNIAQNVEQQNIENIGTKVVENIETKVVENIETKVVEHITTKNVENVEQKYYQYNHKSSGTAKRTRLDYGYCQEGHREDDQNSEEEFTEETEETVEYMEETVEYMEGITPEKEIKA
ncbi:11696_t:CDS:10 [Acaulospora colombiana]|uniref:11696_t:CDS:1 n=1 Tax=Acaulospora colombiana TaxID=27376 RepID=A0ACA9K5M3_9GLOM|nr:11696_t:CDS:10 [Acaulospora colombiana]